MFFDGLHSSLYRQDYPLPNVLDCDSRVRSSIPLRFSNKDGLSQVLGIRFNVISCVRLPFFDMIRCLCNSPQPLFNILRFFVQFFSYSFNSPCQVILVPVLSFYCDYILTTYHSYMLTYVTFWVVSNYADSYWFLYSNKKVIYELRYL